MGNCRGAPSTLGNGGKNRRIPSANPYTIVYNRGARPPARAGLVVPRDPMGRDLDDKYVLGEELDRGEFGVTYLCTEAAMGARMACKSISKRKLRTPVDEEDVRREVEIMRHMLPHTNIVSLSSARAASSSTGWSRGATTPSAPPAVTRTIVEVVQALGCTLPTLHHVFAS